MLKKTQTTLKSLFPKAGQNIETPPSQGTQPKKLAILSSSNTEIDLDKAIQDDWKEFEDLLEQKISIFPLPPEYRIKED